MSWFVRKKEYADVYKPKECPHYTNPDLFTIKLFHGGEMQDNPRNYVGGSVDYIDMCNVDRISLIEVLSMLKHCGGPAGAPILWYKLPGTDMERGLFFLDCDDEVLTMCSLLPSSRYLEVYVVVSPPLRRVHADADHNLNHFEFENIQIQRKKAKSTQVNKRVIDIDDSRSCDDDDDDVVRLFHKTKAKSSGSEASPIMRRGKVKAANNADKDMPLALANAFESNNPFFIHAMKGSNVVGGGWPNVYIPKTFKEAYENWQSNEKVILQVAERSWDVFCSLDCNQFRIRGGWTVFARDNSLNAGDVCVFELINRSKKLFQVFIYRVAKETNRNERSHTVRSEADKARVLKSVEAYKPKHPNFKVKVQKSYMYGGSMTVPMEFINRYITKDSCSVILQLPDGRAWSVKCYIHNKCAKFSAGWKSFSIENNLAVGDFCGFELVKQRLLKVVIFRVES